MPLFLSSGQSNPAVAALWRVGATFVNPNGLTLPVNSVAAYIPVACVARSVVVLAQLDPGSCVIDIRRAPFASYPPVFGGSICAAAKPTLTAGIKYSDATLTGWTTALAAGDTLFFTLESVSGLTVIDVALYLETLSP